MPKIPNWSVDRLAGRPRGTFVGNSMSKSRVEKAWVYDGGNNIGPEHDRGPMALGVVNTDPSESSHPYEVRLQALSPNGTLQDVPWIKGFKTKEDAMDFAKQWMRNHQTPEEVIHGN